MTKEKDFIINQLKNDRMLQVPSKNNIKSSKGVTLIALVVTIIVLIMLATASINIVFGEDGILRKASELEEQSTNKSQDEESELNEVMSAYSNMMEEAPASYVDISLVNTPKITEGMIPVKWNGENWVKTTTMDSEWYSYIEQKWANVVLGEAKFSETGELDETEPYSMLVWIPRYAYKIESGWNQDTEELLGGAGEISVIFVGVNNKDKDGNLYDATYKEATANAETTNKMSKYVVHPAFTYGTKELEGIWIGKYESSNTTGTTGYDETYVMQIKPNVTSWRGIQLSDVYAVCRNLNVENNIYGLNTKDIKVDPHLIKNIEWGAVAYLSRSNEYGKKTSEIYINNSGETYTTGVAVGSGSESEEGTINAYPNSVEASTTGNIYGIFDMSGGAWEYVSAYVNNSYIQDTTSEQYGYGRNLISEIDGKYKDVYEQTETDDQITNYTTNKDRYGDALYEISSNGDSSPAGWYGDYTNFAFTTSPFLVRGGSYSDYNNAGIFSFNGYNGNAGTNYSFRVAISVL